MKLIVYFNYAKFCTTEPFSRVNRTDDEKVFVLPKILRPTRRAVSPHKRLKLRKFTELAVSFFFKKPVKILKFNYGSRKYVSAKIYSFSKLIFKKYRIFKKLRDCHLLLCALFTSLKFKDTKILVQLLRNHFEGVHYSKHRAIFYFWRFLIHTLLPRFFIFYNIGGVKLEFHGKLGVGGNSKKRSYYFKRGLNSNSTKFLKIDLSKSFFRTDTGVVGFTYSIFY